MDIFQYHGLLYGRMITRDCQLYNLYGQATGVTDSLSGDTNLSPDMENSLYRYFLILLAMV
jgi:hypothetical protein